MGIYGQRGNRALGKTMNIVEKTETVINRKQGNFGNGNREIKEYGENGKTFKT